MRTAAEPDRRRERLGTSPLQLGATAGLSVFIIECCYDPFAISRSGRSQGRSHAECCKRVKRLQRKGLRDFAMLYTGPVEEVMTGSQLAPDRPDDTRVRAALAKILASETFHGAKRSAEFLRYAVEMTLHGQSHQIKELTIGQEVFSKRKFDPKTDPTVRREGARLRDRLNEYYQGEGASDPVRVTFRKGSYVPSFTFSRPPRTIEPNVQSAASSNATQPLDVGSGFIGNLNNAFLELLRNAAATRPPQPSAAESLLKPLKDALFAGRHDCVYSIAADVRLEALSPLELREVYALLDIAALQGEISEQHKHERALIQYAVARRLLSLDSDRLDARYLFCSASKMAVKVYWEQRRWADVIVTIDTMVPVFRKTLPALGESTLATFKYLRLAALCADERFDQVTSEKVWLELGGVLEEDIYSEVLVIVALVFGRTEDEGGLAWSLKELWALAQGDNTRLVRVVSRLNHTARSLAHHSQWRMALHIVDSVAAKTRGCSDSQVLEEYAAALYLGTRYTESLDNGQEALARYAHMEQDLSGIDAVAVKEYALWAGVEAARAMRSLEQHTSADELTASLEERFKHLDTPESRKALAWATVELSKTPFAAKDYVRAAELCSEFLVAHEGTGPGSELEWPLAWAYAQKVCSLRHARQFEEAIKTCDLLVSHFGDSKDADVQFEIAWTLMEKVVVLRHSEHLGASAVLARQVAAQFAESKDPRIVRQVAWTLHMEGDALLCEAKVLLRAGLEDDAHIKLRQASRLFLEAFRRDPRENSHLQCICYSSYLLGDIASAKRAFDDASAIGPIRWIKDDSWLELSMFPVTVDREFLDALQCWLRA